MIALAGVALVRRLLVGLAVAAVVAGLLALAIDGKTFVEAFGIACLLVGAVTLVLAFGGHSPSMRLGTQDAWLASFFPGLANRLGDRYPKTTISDSAVFVLVAVVLLVIGAALL